MTKETTETEKAQRDELSRLRKAVETYKMKIALAKLTHLRPLMAMESRIRLERDIARAEGLLDERAEEDFGRRMDELPARIRSVKRDEIAPLAEELAQYERRKRALLVEIESGQQRMLV